MQKYNSLLLLKLILIRFIKQDLKVPFFKYEKKYANVFFCLTVNFIFQSHQNYLNRLAPTDITFVVGRSYSLV